MRRDSVLNFKLRVIYSKVVNNIFYSNLQKDQCHTIINLNQEHNSLSNLQRVLVLPQLKEEERWSLETKFYRRKRLVKNTTSL
jgi:hypothetical protein